MGFSDDAGGGEKRRRRYLKTKNGKKTVFFWMKTLHFLFSLFFLSLAGSLSLSLAFSVLTDSSPLGE